MKGAGIENGAGIRKRALLGSLALTLGAAAIGSAATQFVAYRVGYHPAIGAPVIGNLYPPWDWIEWQSAPWAANAKRSFQIVDAGLFGAGALALAGCFLVSATKPL